MSDGDEWGDDGGVVGDSGVEAAGPDSTAGASSEAAPDTSLPEALESPSGGFYRQIGEYTSLAFVFPVSMLLGFFAGRWLGGWLGSPGIGSALGLVLGTGAAFLSLYRSLRRLESLGESAESGEKPPSGPAP